MFDFIIIKNTAYFLIRQQVKDNKKVYLFETKIVFKQRKFLVNKTINSFEIICYAKILKKKFCWDFI